MTIKTYAEQLEDVQIAIAVIEGGAQSVSLNGRTVSHADLGTLYTREQWLRKMAARETRGGIRVRGVTPVKTR